VREGRRVEVEVEVLLLREVWWGESVIGVGVGEPGPEVEVELLMLLLLFASIAANSGDVVLMLPRR
jgi:hypothetical protein